MERPTSSRAGLPRPNHQPGGAGSVRSASIMAGGATSRRSAVHPQVAAQPNHAAIVVGGPALAAKAIVPVESNADAWVRILAAGYVQSLASGLPWGTNAFMAHLIRNQLVNTYDMDETTAIFVAHAIAGACSGVQNVVMETAQRASVDAVVRHCRPGKRLTLDMRSREARPILPGSLSLAFAVREYTKALADWNLPDNLLPLTLFLAILQSTASGTVAGLLAGKIGTRMGCAPARTAMGDLNRPSPQARQWLIRMIAGVLSGVGRACMATQFPHLSERWTRANVVVVGITLYGFSRIALEWLLNKAWPQKPVLTPAAIARPPISPTDWPQVLGDFNALASQPQHVKWRDFAEIFELLVQPEHHVDDAKGMRETVILAGLQEMRGLPLMKHDGYTLKAPETDFSCLHLELVKACAWDVQLADDERKEALAFLAEEVFSGLACGQ